MRHLSPLDICRQHRGDCMQAARDFPLESGIFVRLAWDWHRSIMRQIAAERDNRELESRAPRAVDYGT